MADTETYLSVLTSSSDAGWTPIVAWNPVDIYTVSTETINPNTAIENFVKLQQKSKRLIIGYLSYDLGSTLHNVTLSTDDDLSTPIAFIISYDNWMTFEHNNATLHSTNTFFAGEVKTIMARTPRATPTHLYRKELSPSWSRKSYNEAYARIIGYITAGDIYQVNLTHRLEGTSDERGLDIYRSISSRSHADFQSYITGSDFEVISASPERFVSIKNGIIKTMPVKGTRPRGKNAHIDEEIRADLLTSTKDMAELDMITDLLRNDLGVVSEIGSVDVVHRRVLTSYPTLWHAHSEIQSRLRPEVSPIGALLSLMPGGSITGCPKKRAMEIVDELEDKRRGIYTGSIFTIGPDGNLDSNIAIRTMIKKSKKLYLSVGGGIIYDSKQSDEYEESLQKAAAFANR